MSGIFGVFYRDGRPVESDVLERMLQSLAHRGPDGGGLWKEGVVGLGHQMLHTTPESLHEKLPFVHRSGDFVITADARIDNRDELFRLLNMGGRPKADVADSELILAAYERWGEKCPEKLIGDFAFAIWDQRERKLLCARDHMGVRPLVYFISDRVFIYATEIKAILKHSGVPRRLNELKVAEYLVANFDDKAGTFYQDILRLPAAHYIVVSEEGVRSRRYWSPELSGSIKLSSDAEYADAFRELFSLSVQCRLRSAFPVGSSLSGGLDSSSVVGMAHQLLSADEDKRLHTFSAIFPSLEKVDPRIDERSYIDAVLAFGDFESHLIRADRLSPWIDLLWKDDEAIPVPNLYLEHAILGVARQSGVRVVLNGLDGDNTVSHGHELLPELVRTGKWRKLNAEVTSLAHIMGVGRKRIVWRLGIKPLIPENVTDIYRTVRSRNRQSGNDAAEIVNSGFARDVNLTERIKTLEGARSTGKFSVREHHWRAVGSGLLQSVLEWQNKVAAVNQVEARCPFFDQRLIQFCLLLPPEQKFRRGLDRAIVRQAMSGLLPELVLLREQKSDLGANFRSGLLDKERDMLEKVVWKDLEHIRQYVNVEAVQTAYRRYEAQPLNREQDAVNTFLVVVLASWLLKGLLTQ